jgi:outer membrane protein assembly factor BamA
LIGRGTVWGAPQSQPPAAPLPILNTIKFEGLSAFGQGELIEELGLRRGEPLPRPTAAIAERLERHYRDEGYSYATVTGAFDGESGTLTLSISEGRIDDIVFEGVDIALGDRLLRHFDIHPGDIFNQHEIGRAVQRVLAPTHGAIENVEGWAPSDTPDVPREHREAIQLVTQGNRRVLVVHLRPRVGRFNLDLGTGEREDWFSPVDAFAPALGFTGTVFDPKGFNHTLISGFASYKFGRDDVGYAIGFERPVFLGPRVFAGAEVHDLTASDDVWRLSRDEQSLVALGFKNTFRDYYDRRGVQVHAAVRFSPQHEFMVAYRRDHHDPLPNETDYSFFRDDHAYRPNPTAAAGVFNGMVFGYTFESRTFERASLVRTYRRHQMDDLFGSFGGSAPGYRVEWTTETASTDTFGGTFDFTRHILNARAYTRPTPHQYVNARFIGGIGQGTLPPQRIFGLGGIGSVRGYSFKEAKGQRMALINLEYKIALGDQPVKGVAFFDAGRVMQPIEGSTDAWLKGIGLGIEISTIQIGFGWRLDDIPKSLQVLVRFNPLF